MVLYLRQRHLDISLLLCLSSCFDFFLLLRQLGRLQVETHFIIETVIDDRLEKLAVAVRVLLGLLPSPLHLLLLLLFELLGRNQFLNQSVLSLLNVLLAQLRLHKNPVHEVEQQQSYGDHH